MKTLKGTRTEKNLMDAFAGESQARNRYTFFASAAKKEGYEEIGAAFQEIAEQEKEHAKRLFKFFEGGSVEITSSFPAGVIGATAESLKASAAGEHHEHSKMYPDYAKIAEEEGFAPVATIMRAIAQAEKHHQERFLAHLKSLETGTVFKREKPVRWRCRNCGYVHEGTEPPAACPACAHPRAFFEAIA
jgi:rubrerythrin